MPSISNIEVSSETAHLLWSIPDDLRCQPLLPSMVLRFHHFTQRTLADQANQRTAVGDVIMQYRRHVLPFPATTSTTVTLIASSGFRCAWPKVPHLLVVWDFPSLISICVPTVTPLVFAHEVWTAKETITSTLSLTGRRLFGAMPQAMHLTVDFNLCLCSSPS
ncbi:hypothetical protein TcWFU_009249 [Taenia crassiceps]|uniref:Uncharacterized protein n=1 Tax=Taenia crassiceps TaxID=6207 RepID=A0ABR4PZD5_9CEST